MTPLYWSVVIPLILGFVIPTYYSNLLKTEFEGVYYYDEVHTSLLNRYIHMFFMMFTSYGFLLSVPSFFSFRAYDANYVQLSIYLYYVFHYATFDASTALLVAFHYLPVLYLAMVTYNLFSNANNVFKFGLCVSTVALLIQELFGHYIGGDKPSRVEGVVNAIFYAVYSSSYTLKTIVC